MFTSLSLSRFKCYLKRQDIPLSQITLLYGLNGRGKSSAVQAILLLSQSMKTSNNIDTLPLAGNLINLGMYSDVLNASATQNSFAIGLSCKTIEGIDDNVFVEYTKSPDTPLRAQMQSVDINGQSRADSLTSQNAGEGESSLVTISVSDSVCLQMLKDISYIAANRLGVSNEESRLGVNVLITPKGENVLNVLSTAPIPFVDEVEEALSRILFGATVRVKNEADRIELFLDSVVNSKHQYKPTNVGFGYGYVLPTIVQTLSAKNDSILIVENPESHLHPGAQSRLMEFLVNQAVEKNLQLIIESHSDHIANGLRIAVKKEVVSPSNVSILHFNRSMSDSENPNVDVIQFDKHGNLSDYPDDFMDEWTKQLEQLMM